MAAPLMESPKAASVSLQVSGPCSTLAGLPTTSSELYPVNAHQALFAMSILQELASRISWGSAESRSAAASALTPFASMALFARLP